MGRPRKIKRPVCLETALLTVLPEKRPEHRRKIFRAWRVVVLTANLKQKPTDQEIEAEIQIFREPDFDAASLHPFFWDSLKDFVPVYQKENRRKKAQSAAVIRWSKETPEQRAKED